MDQPSRIIVNIVRLLRFIAKIILAGAEMLARSTPATHRAIGHYSPMTYRHDVHAVRLQEIPFFVSLLEDIRHHFLISRSTRLIYATIAEHFFFALDSTTRGQLKIPTEQDFYDYVFYNWPMFTSSRSSIEGGIQWGWVGKGDHEPNEVNISSDLVVAAATWDSRHPLPLNLYKLIITVTILHEMSHSFTKHYFNQLFTPLGIGIGPLMSTYGESGWLAEERLFGGRFVIYWDDGKEEGNLATINHVVLNSGPGSWSISVATNLLASLQHPRLDWPAKPTLTPYLPTSGSARALLTKTNEPSTTGKASTLGLGFTFEKGAFSFIGDDRRI